jgi:histidinol-phosphate aminotransferase
MSVLTEIGVRPSALEDLVRPAVRAMPTYAREAGPGAALARYVRLDWNESPYGPSPKARAALAAFGASHRYPDIDARELREALGAYVGAPAEQVVVGAGLDDVLKTMATALLDPGDRVVISEPTFGVYRPLFARFGAEVVDAPLGEGFALDPERVLAAIDGRTKVVLVCNPNNPTGTLFGAAAVERIVAEAPCLVAVDEAYAEFAGVAHRPLMERYGNVAVLRTLSKFAGLAGLRVGYGVFPPALVPFVLRVMPEFGNVAGASAAAAIASLDDLAYLEGVIGRIVADREALAEGLRRLPGVEPVPSATNFLLVRLPVAGMPVVAELAERGVFVRSYGRPDLADYLRVTIGTPEENGIFLHELGDLLGLGADLRRSG